MKKNYHITLKGFVGGYDFSAADVDRLLKNMDGKPVDVLIDSTGGYVATALSISAAFANHGDVSVHFRGMNASAATVASMGARHISIDRAAMYLVHKASVEFFKWADVNADSLQSLIDKCTRQRDDLNKIDLNIASLYAARCKRPVKQLLDLMAKGAWLSAQDALDWGFVDEITDLEEDTPPEISDSMVKAFASAGIPVPQLSDTRSMIRKILDSLTAIFSSDNNTKQITNMPTDDKDNTADIIAAKDREIADLKARLATTPADDTTKVTTTDKKSGEKDECSGFIENYNAAKDLLNQVR